MLNIRTRNKDVRWYLPKRISGNRTLSSFAREFQEEPLFFTPETIKERISKQLTKVLHGLHLGEKNQTELYILDSPLNPLSFSVQKFINYLAWDKTFPTPNLRFEQMCLLTIL